MVSRARSVRAHRDDLYGNTPWADPNATCVQAKRLLFSDQLRGCAGYQHVVTLARSLNICGPDEGHTDLHVICADGADGPIERTGHGQYEEAQWDGPPVLVSVGGRGPLPQF